MLFYGMFSVLCVLAINDNPCVYIHEQAMVNTPYLALGVNTLLYLKHQLFFDILYTTGVITTYHSPLFQFFKMLAKLCCITIYKYALDIPQCFCAN